MKIDRGLSIRDSCAGGPVNVFLLSVVFPEVKGAIDWVLLNEPARNARRKACPFEFSPLFLTLCTILSQTLIVKLNSHAQDYTDSRRRHWAKHL